MPCVVNSSGSFCFRSYPDTNAFSSLLQYSVKLPFVDITHLEPFFILQANATVSLFYASALHAHVCLCL